ncbi:flagellar basal body rod protein FlgB [Niveibacterium sp.]|uniref:flagellar basal body rod protein FlgB n=1 Tax=Niveibacterium sp. TaxID=2017444 RepID=UPI0035AF9ED6
MSAAHGSSASAPPVAVSGGGAPTAAVPLQQLPLARLNSSGAVQAGGHFHEQMLSVLARRQAVIASNIANADTPNYLARDIDLPSVALALHNAGATLSLGRTHAAHQVLLPPTPAEPLLYAVPLQGAVDGNSVEMDIERAKFAENAVRYEFAVGQVSGHYKMMKELLDSIR